MNLKINFSKTEGVNVNYDLKIAVRRAILETLLYEKFEYDTEVSVTFTDNAYIKKLNTEYRGIKRHTDVLSFPMYEREELGGEACQLGVLLGDIVISLERAAEQAAELGNSYLREVSFLAIHSTLHLLGYDHERSAEDEEEQCQRQRKIIERLDVK